MKPSQDTVFVVTFVPKPGDWRSPIMRLRSLLKIAGRSLGLKATNIVTGCPAQPSKIDSTHEDRA
jgi:hypothetical protein